MVSLHKPDSRIALSGENKPSQLGEVGVVEQYATVPILYFSRFSLVSLSFILIKRKLKKASESLRY